MKTPLLQRSERKAQANLGFRIFFFSLVGILAFLVLFQLSVANLEERVGAPPQWAPLLDTYFELGGLCMSKLHGDPYKLNVDPTVDMELCKQQSERLDCKTACMKKLQGLPVGPYCIKAPVIRAFDSIDYCWDTSKMGCWNQRGGSQVYYTVGGATHEFLLHEHYTGAVSLQSKSPLMHYMLMSGTSYHFLMFGVGSVRQFEGICEKILQFEELLKAIATIPPDRTILIGGHSEGSGWAICLNDYLTRMGNLNTRYVIASGTLVPSTEFYERRDERSRENSLFLMSANTLPDMFAGGGILPDVLSIYRLKSGVILPHFGFMTDHMRTECLTDFHGDQPFDLNAGIRRMIAKTRGLEHALQEVHGFRNYREGFRLCKPLFEQIENFNFEPNLPAYSIMRLFNSNQQEVITLLPYSPQSSPRSGPSSSSSPSPTSGGSSLAGPSAISPIPPHVMSGERAGSSSSAMSVPSSSDSPSSGASPGLRRFKGKSVPERPGATAVISPAGSPPDAGNTEKSRASPKSFGTAKPPRPKTLSPRGKQASDGNSPPTAGLWPNDPEHPPPLEQQELLPPTMLQQPAPSSQRPPPSQQQQQAGSSSSQGVSAQPRTPSIEELIRDIPGLVRRMPAISEESDEPAKKEGQGQAENERLDVP